MGWFNRKNTKFDENEWDMCLKEITAFLTSQSQRYNEEIGNDIDMVISRIQHPKSKEEKDYAERTARVSTVYLRLHKQTRLRLYRIIDSYFK